MANEYRFIDANAYAESWRQVPDECESYTARQVIEDIISFPTVDAAEVVHATWEERYIPNGKYVAWDGFYCSACGNKAAKSRYCPNCGAKMDGDRNA